MIFYKTKEEVERIRSSAEILGKTHGEVAKWIKPDVETKQLDQIAEEYIKDHGGIPSFKGYRGYSSTLCVSVNENVVHGIPGGYRLKEGDIVSVDCGVYFQGFHSDSAYTYPVGQVEDKVKKFLSVTKESLNKGIEAAVSGSRIGAIGYAIQNFVQKEGYSVVRELVGHGIGKNLHEGPEVPNYGKRGEGAKLGEGLVIAIEPMINMGKKNVVQEMDGWTIRTADRSLSAHYEHTVVIWKDKTEVLTTFKYIEEHIKF